MDEDLVRRVRSALERLVLGRDPKEIIDILKYLYSNDSSIIESFCEGIEGCIDTWNNHLSDKGKKVVIKAVRTVLIKRSMVPLENDAEAEVYRDICPLLLRFAYVPFRLDYLINSTSVMVEADLKSAQKTLNKFIDSLPNEISGLRDCLNEIKNLLGSNNPVLPQTKLCYQCRKKENCERYCSVQINPCFFASPHFVGRVPQLILMKEGGQLLLRYKGIIVARIRGIK